MGLRFAILVVSLTLGFPPALMGRTPRAQTPEAPTIDPLARDPALGLLCASEARALVLPAPNPAEPPNDPAPARAHEEPAGHRPRNAGNAEEAYRVALAEAQARSLDPVVERNQPQISLSLADLKHLAITRNYHSRLEAERIFQARHQVNVAIGRLLPSLNLGVAFSIGFQVYAELIVSTIGFAYPSHWFRWRESKLYLEAERRSFAVMLADQVNAVEQIYYRIAMVKASAEIYAHYIALTDEVVRKVEATIADRNLIEQAVRETINFRIALELDLGLILKTTANLHTDLFFALGLDPKTWARYTVAPYDFPDIQQWPRLPDLEARFDLVVARSQEVAMLTYLEKAARFSLFARAFDFTMPGASPDSSLGFGTASTLQIAHSREREFGVRIDEMKARLRSALEKTVVAYNSGTLAYAKFSERLHNGERLYDFLMARLDRLAYFDDNMADALNFIVSGTIGRLWAQHWTVGEAANMHRMLWDDPIYERILQISQAKKPERHLKLWQTLENQKIKKALQRGLLVLPNN